jgi:hypothetical protein
MDRSFCCAARFDGYQRRFSSDGSLGVFAGMCGFSVLSHCPNLSLATDSNGYQGVRARTHDRQSCQPSAPDSSQILSRRQKMAHLSACTRRSRTHIHGTATIWHELIPQSPRGNRKVTRLESLDDLASPALKDAEVANRAELVPTVTKPAALWGAEGLGAESFNPADQNL